MKTEREMKNFDKYKKRCHHFPRGGEGSSVSLVNRK